MQRVVVGGPALLSAWLVHDWHGAPANVAPDEHDDIGWFSLEELPPPPHVIVRATLLGALRGTRDEPSTVAQTD